MLSLLLQCVHVSAGKESQFPEITAEVVKMVELKEVIAAAHKEMTLIYHAIGKHILAFEAQHGWTIKKVLHELYQELQQTFPGVTGLSSRNLQYIRKFSKEYPDLAAVKEIIAQLPWSHIESILGRVRKKDDQLFYMKKSIEHRWSRSALVKQIQSALHNQETIPTPAQEPTVNTHDGTNKGAQCATP